MTSADLLSVPGSLPREIIAALREPFVVLDRHHRVLAASEPFYLQFGLRAADSVGESINALGGGAWAGTGLDQVLAEQAPSQAVIEDYPVLIPTGTDGTVPMLCSVRPIRAAANQIDLFLVSFRHAPRELAPAGAELDALQRLADEHVTDLVALYRRDGTCLFAGSASDALLGYGRDEWLALRPCQVVHPDDQERLVRTARLRDGPAARLTVRARRKSGDYLWLEAAVQVVEDADLGEVIHVSARDVTQRRRAEEAVQWLSRQVKLILDTAAEGIFGVDPRGLITFVNPAAAQTLGFEVPELTGQEYTALLSPEALRADEIMPVLRDGIARRSASTDFVRRDGSRVTVEYTCSPARQQDRVVGGVVTFRDITERLRADAALRRSEWLAGVGQTVLTVRHEINNPLTTLLAEASMLEAGGYSPEEEREMLGSIVAQARRIRDVIRRLTAEEQSRAEEAREHAAREAFDRLEATDG